MTRRVYKKAKKVHSSADKGAKVVEKSWKVVGEKAITAESAENAEKSIIERAEKSKPIPRCGRVEAWVCNGLAAAIVCVILVVLVLMVW